MRECDQYLFPPIVDEREFVHALHRIGESHHCYRSNWQSSANIAKSVRHLRDFFFYLSLSLSSIMIPRNACEFNDLKFFLHIKFILILFARLRHGSLPIRLGIGLTLDVRCRWPQWVVHLFFFFSSCLLNIFYSFGIYYVWIDSGGEKAMRFGWNA